MEGLSWPLALYDLIGVLVPGLMVPAAIGLISIDFFAFYDENLLVVLLGSYVMGHVVQAFSKLTFRLVDTLWRYKGFLDVTHPELRWSILQDLEAFYGGWVREAATRPQWNEELLKNLCYSPVWNRMDNYKLFIALADLCRALAFLSGLASLLLAGGLIGIWAHVMECQSSGWILSALLAGFFLLTDRSRFFRRLAEGVVYYSFLAFAAEGKLGSRHFAGSV